MKQFYLKRFDLALVNKVRFIQVLLFNTNYSIKHQSFVYTQLNDQTILFQAIQFSIIHLFAPCLNVKQFYLIGPDQMLQPRARVDLRGMTMNGYLAYYTSLALQEPHHQIV